MKFILKENTDTVVIGYEEINCCNVCEERGCYAVEGKEEFVYICKSCLEEIAKLILK